MPVDVSRAVRQELPNPSRNLRKNNRTRTLIRRCNRIVFHEKRRKPGVSRKRRASSSIDTINRLDYTMGSTLDFALVGATTGAVLLTVTFTTPVDDNAGLPLSVTRICRLNTVPFDRMPNRLLTLN